MNYSVYMFGELAQGYSQYPDDSSSNIFKSVLHKTTTPSRLVIHRDGNLMYYMYIRRLYGEKAFGIALVVNDFYFTDIAPLFSLFEEEISRLAQTGVILCLRKDGNLDTTLSGFPSEEEEVTAESNWLRTRIESLKCLRRLPNLDFSVAIDSQKIFEQSDDLKEIIDASWRFGYTVVLKEKDYDAVRLNSYRVTLRKLTEEKKELIKENEQLTAKYNKSIRQKKQFKNVVLLCIVVVGCVIGLLILKNNLTQTRGELSNANDTIERRDLEILYKTQLIEEKQDSLETILKKLDRERIDKERLQDVLTKLSAYSPISITGSNLSNSHLQFRYYSPNNQTLSLTLRVVNSWSGRDAASSLKLNFQKGYGSMALDLPIHLYVDQSYYVLLQKDDKIIVGEEW